MISQLAFAIIFINTYTIAAISPQEGRVASVWVVTGGRADLPCDSQPKVPHDRAIIVLWYFASVTKPIYSYDARDGDFTKGKSWSDEMVGGRVNFRPAFDPPTLVIDPTQPRDEGMYNCRVEYRVSPPTIATVNLTVVIPPGPPMVIWGGRGVVGVVGPIKEKDSIKLTCRSVGGRPTPTITWWNDETRLQLLSNNSTSDPVTGTYAVEATLSITGKRDLQAAPLTCHVHTSTEPHILKSSLLHPKTASVTLNVTLPPVEVRILGSASIETTSGSEISLVCKAYGSHPPTQITWWREREPLEEFAIQNIEDGGNVTTSRLTMTVGREDDGSVLSCQAMNPAIPEQILIDTTNLNVLYAPVVRLTLGRQLVPESIKEGDDVYFECNISSNPRHHRIEWYHNGMELVHNMSAGVVMSGLSLVLPGLQRSHSGSYKCSAANLQGNATSNAVHLTVRHAPVCAGPDVERTQGAVRGATTTVQCTVEAEPSIDITWAWMKMRVDGTEEEVALNLIQSNGLSSSIQVTPQRQEDYGRLLCRAANAVGHQQVACVISLMPAGPPDMPTNCSATTAEEETETEIVEDSSINIRCIEGFDGGLQQYFLLEAWQDGQLLGNLSSDKPEWVLNGARVGAGVTITISAHNARGRSDSLNLEVNTSNAQQHAAPDYRGIAALAPLLGAVAGAVLVVLLLLAVGVVIVRRSPRRPLKSEDNIPRTSTIPEGFDPDVVQSIQRQPPSLDVLPCLQEQEGQAGHSSLDSASDTVNVQKYTEPSSKDQSYEQLLYEKAEEQLCYTSLPRTQKSKKKDNLHDRQGLRYTISPSDDSGVSESESDSEIKELVSKGQVKKRLNPKGGERGIPTSYVTFSAEGGGAHHQLSSITDHLTEPSTSSGDSGIQSSSSTKPFSLFASSEEKPRAAATAAAAVVMKDFRSQLRASGKQQFSPQSSGGERQLSSPSSGDLRRGLPMSVMELSSPSSVTTQPGVIYSKDHSPDISGVHLPQQLAEPLHPLPIGEQSRHKLLDFGRPVTLVEGEHDEVLLLRRTLPKTDADKSRRYSALAFTNDKIYDLSPTRYSSSSDLQCLGYSNSSILRDISAARTHHHDAVFYDDQSLVKGTVFYDDQNLVKGTRSEMLPHSPSVSDFSHKDMKVTVKDIGGLHYKFPFNFNFSERESSV